MRHSFEFNLGLLFNISSLTTTNVGEVSTSSSNYIMGGFSYYYWFMDNFSFKCNISVLSTDVSVSASTSETNVETAVVLPVLFGLKYKPPIFDSSEKFHPYLSASVGPCFGFASNVQTAGIVNQTKSVTETAYGSHLGLGVDIGLTRLLYMNIGTGYYLISDFENNIGSSKNYSSPDFTISLGLNFGY
jgi:outer membrane protein W